MASFTSIFKDPMVAFRVIRQALALAKVVDGHGDGQGALLRMSQAIHVRHNRHIQRSRYRAFTRNYCEQTGGKVCEAEASAVLLHP